MSNNIFRRFAGPAPRVVRTGPVALFSRPTSSPASRLRVLDGSPATRATRSHGFLESGFMVTKLLLGLVGFAIAAELIVLLAGKLGKPVKKPLAEYADQVYAACKATGYPPSCYDQEIPKLMSVLTMEEAFNVTKLVQEKDQRYLYCHVLAHKLSYQEVSKDLSKWKDVVTRCPATFCNNGCQHGALMRRFNAESLTDEQIEAVKPDLADVCEPRGTWSPTEVERSMCYHALGHLHMYITKADVNKSVSLCKTVGSKEDGRNYEQTCTEGALMTIFQPLEPEDIALVRDIAPRKEKAADFCARYEGEAFHACRRESWPLFLSDIQKPEGLTKFCHYSSDRLAVRKCLGTAFNILTIYMVVDNNNKLDKISEFCSKLSFNDESECYLDVARRLVQIDPRYDDVALGVCGVAAARKVGDACYEEVARFGGETYHTGSRELDTYCAKLPTAWQEQCRKGTIVSK